MVSMQVCLGEHDAGRPGVGERNRAFPGDKDTVGRRLVPFGPKGLTVYHELSRAGEREREVGEARTQDGVSDGVSNGACMYGDVAGSILYASKC